jgi:hypothetical protein
VPSTCTPELVEDQLLGALDLLAGQVFEAHHTGRSCLIAHIDVRLSGLKITLII